MDMSSVPQWRRLVDKLTKSTRSERIKWSEVGDHVQRNDQLSPLFMASYGRWHLLVYQYGERHWTDPDNYVMEEEVAIELVDKDARCEWMLPKVPNRFELLDAIQFSHSGAADFLREMLQDEETE